MELLLAGGTLPTLPIDSSSSPALQDLVTELLHIMSEDPPPETDAVRDVFARHLQRNFDPTTCT